MGRCPFHEERTASFTVYPDGHYKCYGCGKWGWADDLLGKKHPCRENSLAPEPEKQWPTLETATLTLAAKENSLSGRLAAWRVYSELLCAWLIARGHVLEFQGQIAFPIRQNGRVVRLHVRKDERVDWKSRGEQPFFYWPAVGAKVDCFVIRTAGNEAHMHESQFDAMAAFDALRRPGMHVATRGASSCSKIQSLTLPKLIYAWPQNDDAGESWLTALRSYLPNRCELRVVRMPDGVKDANDLLRSGLEFVKLPR